MKPSDAQPGLYVKGSAVRKVTTPAEAVDARWRGFVPAQEQPVENVDYRDLQEQAKSVGIPANQSASALQEALASYEVQPVDEDYVPGDTPVPDTDPDQEYNA